MKLCCVCSLCAVWHCPHRQVSAGPSNYTGLFHGLRSVVKAEGVFGLYKGIGPALFLTSHGAVQFVAYEKLKAICRSSKIDMVRTSHPGAQYVIGGCWHCCVRMRGTTL